MKCGDFPGPGISKRRVLKNSEIQVLMNPLKEYIHNYDQHHQELFEKFKMTHNRAYTGKTEHASRFSMFKNNVRYSMMYIVHVIFFWLCEVLPSQSVRRLSEA